MMALGEILVSSSSFFLLLPFLLWKQLPGLHTHLQLEPLRGRSLKKGHFISSGNAVSPVQQLSSRVPQPGAAVSMLQSFCECNKAAAAHSIPHQGAGQIPQYHTWENTPLQRSMYIDQQQCIHTSVCILI